jgi:hypothetical protein
MKEALIVHASLVQVHQSVHIFENEMEVIETVCAFENVARTVCVVEDDKTKVFENSFVAHIQIEMKVYQIVHSAENVTKVAHIVHVAEDLRDVDHIVHVAEDVKMVPVADNATMEIETGCAVDNETKVAHIAHGVACKMMASLLVHIPGEELLQTAQFLLKQ